MVSIFKFYEESLTNICTSVSSGATTERVSPTAVIARSIEELRASQGELREEQTRSWARYSALLQESKDETRHLTEICAAKEYLNRKIVELEKELQCNDAK
jgi:hypothetical protein